VPESTGTSGRAQHALGAHPHHGPGPLAAVAVGGALGTLARYGVERAAGPSDHGFPWATLSVNVVGSFVLGAVLTLVVERWPRDRYLRPLVAVGFCGGFTTFATMAVEIDQRIRHGLPILAAWVRRWPGSPLSGGGSRPSPTDRGSPTRTSWPATTSGSSHRPGADPDDPRPADHRRGHGCAPPL
jgi:protein CrcB